MTFQSGRAQKLFLFFLNYYYFSPKIRGYGGYGDMLPIYRFARGTVSRGRLALGIILCQGKPKGKDSVLRGK